MGFTFHLLSFLGCPYCSHRRFKDLSLASLYPEMAKDWDYAKNDKELSPDTISPNSEKLVWWKCEHGVEWRQNVVSRKKSYLHGRSFLCFAIFRISSMRNL